MRQVWCEFKIACTLLHKLLDEVLGDDERVGDLGYGGTRCI